MTFTLEVTPELEQGLRASAVRADLPPNRSVRDVLKERLSPANRGPAGLPRAEADLLERVNEGLPEGTRFL